MTTHPSTPTATTTLISLLVPAKQESIQNCCISFCSTDLIRLIAVPAEIINNVRTCIKECWERPIQREQNFRGYYEFKLKGNPWGGRKDEEVKSRRLVAAILTEMAKNGWNILQSSRLTSLEEDHDSIFFRKCTPDPNAKIFSISLSDYDLIRIIDAPDPEIVPVVKQAVVAHWPKGFKTAREYHGSVELKLYGVPWGSVTTVQSVYARTVLLQLISNLRGMGFKLYGSFNLWYQDSWFFREIGPTWKVGSDE